ncbi:hypothetical protein [Streptomyces sp. NPDC127105]|uniref:hypothetical protein n=1 Tax=Streptomyces sp. NPDC127105 TaxID=3345359 RepID=UPI00364986C5
MAELLGFRPTDIGAAALVGLIVLLILRGHLVPRRVLEDRLADKDRQLEDVRAERNTWRQAHTVSEEARHEAQDQAAELLELSRTAGHFFASLPEARREVRASADANPAPATPPP